ncbi:MAG: hypothetical protein IT204_23795 [Fimbriimonadaceae bacterium]|nr:hypothetical protein [Fimbriimonadaceae bacterium]
MSVEEMIARLPSLSAADLARLERAVEEVRQSDEATAAGPATDQPVDRRALREMLLAGVCTAGGRALSEGIDEALYGDGS